MAPHDSLATAAERLWSGDCGALPVVSDEGRVVAMITDRDICMATWSRNRPPSELRVEEAMSRSLTACRLADAVETAESAMRIAQVRRLPVVGEDGRLLGIISLADIALANEQAGRTQRSRISDGLSTTLAIICEKPARGSSDVGDAAASEATPALEKKEVDGQAA